MCVNFKINWLFNYDNGLVVTNTFLNTLKNKPLWNKQEPIGAVEETFQAGCYNFGITFVKPGIYDCIGYDFEMFYPTIMASDEFMFPIRSGKAEILSWGTPPLLPTELPFSWVLSLFDHIVAP